MSIIVSITTAKQQVRILNQATYSKQGSSDLKNNSLSQGVP